MEQTRAKIKLVPLWRSQSLSFSWEVTVGIGWMPESSQKLERACFSLQYFRLEWRKDKAKRITNGLKIMVHLESTHYPLETVCTCGKRYV